MSDIRQRAEERVDKKLKFYRNLTAYIIVNAVLAIVNWMFTPEFWWVFFPMFFWGIGVMIDFLQAFVFVDCYGESYRERKIQEEMERLRN